MYFSFDVEYGFNTHKTAEEAQEAAENYLDYYRDYADEGWSENAKQVCWGEIKAMASSYKTGEREILDGQDVEFIDYKLNQASES